MNAKERKEYNNFRSGNDKKKGPAPQDRPFRPVMFPTSEPFLMQPQFAFGFPPQGLPLNPSLNPSLAMPLSAAYRK
jgi:hypothetical protein